MFCVAFVLCALLTKPHALSWNDTSRLATIDALTTHRTFAIDASPFAAKTGDKYRYLGRTYSDKPPALALQGAAVAAVVAPLSISLARTPGTAIYLITLLTVGVWFAVGCAYAFAFAQLLGCDARRAGIVAALTGLGTLALPYATILANHVPSGAAALAGLYHLVRARESPVHAALGGVFLALAYAFDAAAIVFALSAVVLLWGRSVRMWLACAAAGLPVIALQLAYNASVSGGLGPPAMNQASWSDPSSPFHRPVQSLFLFSSAGDYARYAVYLLVGDKGLLSYTPLALLCAYGFRRMLHMGAPYRRVALAVIAAFGAYFVLLVAFTDDYGALNFGERRYVDVFFVLGVALGPALAAVRAGAAAVAARLAIGLSIAISMLGVVAPFGESPKVPGYVFAPEEFARLAHRAPVQAAVDVVALAVMIFLVLRFSSIAAAPTRDTGARAA